MIDGEVITREVILKVIHLCVNIGGVEVKLKMGFNKDHAMKYVQNAVEHPTRTTLQAWLSRPMSVLFAQNH